MRVSHVSLVNFRNYASAELVLEPGLNLLVGRNGQGKTNLAEAIMFFASLRSHRVANESALIRAGEDSAVMRMKLVHRTREALLEFQLNRGAPNRSLLNRNAVRPREMSRVFSAVLFAPEDLSIARDEPSVRRRFLDDALIARYPAAAGVLTDFDRVVRQRNTLLKTAKASGSAEGVTDTLQIWDDQLVEWGSEIIEHRRLVVQDLIEPLREAYGMLVEGDHRPNLTLKESIFSDVSRETLDSINLDPADVSRETIVSSFRRALDRERVRELERGQTLVGPHRDDLILELNGLPVKGYASHGESWSFILSLRLALARILQRDSSLGDPVLILDDVFAELDEYRRSQLISAVREFEQVIITAAVEKDVPVTRDWNVVHIHNGTILPQYPEGEQHD